MRHQHTLNEKKNCNWNGQYLALSFFWCVLHCLWRVWKREWWSWPPTQHRDTVAKGLHPQAWWCAGVSCPQSQLQLFPSKPWSEFRSCPKVHSQASYDILGKVFFIFLWKSVLIQSDSFKFHIFLCICAVLKINSYFRWAGAILTNRTIDLH